MKKLKFVVRSRKRSQIVSDIRAAVDACRADIGTPARSSMQKMRWLIDGKIDIDSGVDFLFFNDEVDKANSNLDDVCYCQLYVCEEV